MYRCAVGESKLQWSCEVVRAGWCCQGESRCNQGVRVGESKCNQGVRVGESKLQWNCWGGCNHLLWNRGRVASCKTYT